MDYSRIELLEQLRAAEQAKEKANQEKEEANREKEKANREKEKANREKDIAEQRAEKMDRQSRPTMLLEYLDAMHLCCVSTLAVQTDKTKATQGSPSDPTNKYCPTHIKAWDDFSKLQKLVWSDLRHLGEKFKSARAFSSLDVIDHLQKMSFIRKIASEKDLEIYEQLMIQEAVTQIMDHLFEYPDAGKKLHMNGRIKFENHSNTLNDGTSLEMRMDGMQITPTHPPPNPPSLLKSADQICVYQQEGETSIPCLIVEYKAPHKLTIPHIKTGLRPMNPLKEFVNNPKIPRDGDHKAKGYYAGKVVAAVVTQTFSYMIEAGLEYAYICTGEAFIFLHIQPEDATTVYYHLSTPNLDVGETTGWEADSDGENRLQLTAVGQVLAFTLQTLRSKPQNPDWIERAKRSLKRWEIDPNQLLDQIPETVRKEIKSLAYRGQSIAPEDKVYRTPHFFRSTTLNNQASRCKPDETVNDGDKFDSSDTDEEGENDHGPVDTPSRSSRSHGTSPRNRGTSSRNQAPSKRTTTDSYDKWYERKDQCRVMAYCTQRCLRGLLTGGLLDENCANVETHRKRDNYHCLNPSTFRKLMRKQLSESLVTDCHALDRQGSRGALFKVRLTSHGYTVAAKCTVWAYISDLLHEAVVYKQLEGIQGIHIPVCLGNIDLPGVLAVSCVQFVHMMFLSWGGQCIDLHAELSTEPHVKSQAVEAMRAIHQLGVLHRDPMPRNMLWSEEVKRVMFIDFERSQIRKASSKRPLMLTCGNEQTKRDAGEDLIAWNNNMRSIKDSYTKEGGEVGSGEPKFQILDEEDVENDVEPVAFDAPKIQILDETTEHKAKPKRSPDSDFARELLRMEAGLMMLTS